MIYSSLRLIYCARRFPKSKRLTPFVMDACVILPEHLHCIWQLPDGDDDFSTRWRLIKSYFSRHLECDERISTSRMRKNERGIWQRRFWEHLVRDDRDFGDHLDYIHLNPVRHGFVSSPSEWPHSSFSKWVERGVYEPNWGSGEKAELPEWAKAFE